MPLVPAVCTQCGAKIEVDNTKEAAICTFCGTPFIVEKAINNYNTNFVTNQIINKTIIGKEIDTYEELIARGNANLEVEKWADARREFEAAAKEKPLGFEAYFGIIFADLSKAFAASGATVFTCDPEILRLFIKTLPADQKDKYFGRLKAYFDYVKNVYEKYASSFEPRIAELDKNVELYKKQALAKQAEADSLVNQRKQLKFSDFKGKSELAKKISALENEVNDLNKKADANRNESSICQSYGAGKAARSYVANVDKLIQNYNTMVCQESVQNSAAQQFNANPNVDTQAYYNNQTSIYKNMIIWYNEALQRVRNQEPEINDYIASFNLAKHLGQTPDPNCKVAAMLSATREKAANFIPLQFVIK